MSGGRHTYGIYWKINLHQVSSLSSYLLTLVSNILIGHIQDVMPKCTHFANDIILIEESPKDVNSKLKVWRKILESKDFHLSKSKTEYMKCNFNKKRTTNDLKVKIEEHIIPKVSNF